MKKKSSLIVLLTLACGIVIGWAIGHGRFQKKAGPLRRASRISSVISEHAKA